MAPTRGVTTGMIRRRKRPFAPEAHDRCSDTPGGCHALFMLTVYSPHAYRFSADILVSVRRLPLVHVQHAIQWLAWRGLEVGAERVGYGDEGRLGDFLIWNAQ